MKRMGATGLGVSLTEESRPMVNEDLAASCASPASTCTSGRSMRLAWPAGHWSWER